MTSDEHKSVGWLDILKSAGAFLLLSVVWGVFYSILSPIIATFQWIGGALGWNSSQSGWVALLVESLQNGWTIALFFAAIVVSYTLLGSLVYAAFRITRRFNQRRLAYFADQHPQTYADLEETVGSMASNVGVWWLCSIVVWLSAIVAYFFGVRSVTWIVAGSVTGVLGIFYVAMLINARHLGRWAFQHVRAFILPYVFVVPPIFSAFAFATLLQSDIATGFFTYFGADFPGSSEGFTFDFSWTPLDLLRAFAASFGSLLLVVWLAPILIKRDYMELVAIAIALVSPWLGTLMLQRTAGVEQQLARLLQVVPLPVLALASAMIVDWLFGAIKGTLVATYQCPVCSNRSRPNIRFCPQCGTPRSNPPESSLVDQDVD